MTNEVRMTNAEFAIRSSSSIRISRFGIQHLTRLPRTSQRAFTLLELLLALTVSVTLAAALSSTLYTAFRARASAERAIEAIHSLDALGEIVGRDLGAALPPTGLLAGTFLGDASSVDFYCSGPEYGAALQGGCRRVQYALSDGEGDTHALVRRAYANLLAPVEVEPKEEQVCGGVADVKFEYYDGASWYDSWDSTQQNDALPVAVRISLSRATDSDVAAAPEISKLFALPCAVSAATSDTAGGVMP